MDDTLRGKIYNRKRASQLKDYSGLRFAKMTPMDLDGVMEFRERLFVFFEYKGEGAPLQFGQKRCIEAIVNAIQSEEKTAVCIVANHNGHISEDIDCANVLVRSFFYDRRWRQPRFDVTVREVVQAFCELSLGWDCELDFTIEDMGA
jgi:hypothetical protein